MDWPRLESDIRAAQLSPENEWCVYTICKRLALSPESCLEAIQELVPELPRKTVLLGVDEYRHSGWPELFARREAAAAKDGGEDE